MRSVDDGSAVERVDDDQPLRARAGQAVVALDDGLDLRRARDADEDDVAPARDLGVRRCLGRAGVEQVAEALAVAVAP